MTRTNRELLRELPAVRAVRIAPQTRDATNDSDDLLGTLYGHFSVFNTWYEISSWWEGEFLERVLPGAFVKTFTERGPGGSNSIVCNFDHGYDPVIGDKVLGGFDTLEEDRTGAYYEVGLLDTSYNRDLAPALRRGLYGASFRFSTIRDAWNEEPGISEHNPKGIPERDLVELRCFEAGPVTYPASPTASANLRGRVAPIGTTDAYYEQLRARDPRSYEVMVERFAALRTPPAAPGGAAPAPTDDAPAASHPSGYRGAATAALARLAARDSRERRQAVLARFE
jgi:HK97 family phage prohead protease